MNKLLDLAKIYKYASIIAPRFNENKDSFEKEYLALASNINKIKSDKDYFLAISKLINTLNDGHTLVTLPKELAETIGYLPFEFICIEGKYYIKGATENLKSCILKEIKSINKVPFSELLYKCFAHTHNVNGYTYWSRIESILPFFLKKKGNVIEFKDNSTQSFNLLKSKEEFAYFSPIKSSYKYEIIHDGDFAINKFENDILYVKIDTFNNSNTINNCVEILSRQKGARAVIIDVRNNEGGMTLNASKLADLFFDKKFSDSIKRTTHIKGLDLASSSLYASASQERLNNWIENGITTQELIDENLRIFNGEIFEEYNSIWGTNKKAAFNCPVVLLTSRYTFSAAEDFVAMFKSNKRATIIGENTYGSTGTGFHLKLSNNMSVRICSVHYTLLDRTEFINIGIYPDLYTPIGIEDLRKGNDTTLNTAIKYLNKN